MDGRNCIHNVFIFPSPFLILSGALQLHLTALNSSAEHWRLVFQSDPVFCRVPNSPVLMPQPSPQPQHTEASMRGLTKPFKCPTNGTKIEGNEISDFKSPFNNYTMWVNWGSHQQALRN